MSKTAVILFNLGGPDELKSVRPFLFNLFNDPAIINLPQPFRWILAKCISIARAPKTRALYEKMGGKSPLLDQTIEQANALEKVLKSKGEYKVFVCMRYWHPMSHTVARNVKVYAPDRIILLPLYPQYSTATTASSLKDWHQAAKQAGLDVPTRTVCCYADDRGLAAAHVKLIRDAYWRASEHGKPRVLFSAHGIPEKLVKAGDPYQWQVEKTVSQIIPILSIDELDYVICYQSRVGPLKWLGPATPDEIKRAGQAKAPVVVVPVAFVSEHVETLVELDIEYRHLAGEHGAPAYERVPALGVEPLFIETAAGLCLKPTEQKRVCPPEYSACACAKEAA